MAEKEYIEREEAKKVLAFDYAYAATELLDEVPTANVQEVRHGKWLKCFEDYRKQILGDKCSVCGFEHYSVLIRNYQYCPNCGAKMDS